MKPVYHKYIILSLIGIISFLFQHKTINEFPQYKHCWAQCDRYALAIGFINNGGDLFHPETYVLNKQFPGDFKVISKTSITSVDFPIHDYIASLFMRIFNTTDPWCFRIYTLLYSIIGLFFLYRLTTLFTDSLLKAVLVILFAITSPTFIYYQGGFLPTIHSLSNALIGLFFFFRYVNTAIKKDYILAVLFITLAALSRLPFAIILVAFVCFELFYIWRLKQIQMFKFLCIIISIVIILFYYCYNTHLRKEYGSLFLNYIIPADNFNAFIEYIVAVYDRWIFKYFSYMHYFLLGALGIYFIINKILKKIKLSVQEKKLALLVFIILIGCKLYYILMSFQFLDHDYYFLDTFYIPVILLFLFLIVKIPLAKHKVLQLLSGAFSVSFFLYTFIYANKIQSSEKEIPFYKVNSSTAENFKNADEFLDSLHISKDAKILTMGSDGPNNPFLLMRRKGYAVIYPDSEKIKVALKWPYDYVVLENSKMISQIYNSYPEVIGKLTKIAGNDKITVYNRKKRHAPVDVNVFFSLDTKPKMYYQRISFDTIPENCSGVENISNYCFSGAKAGFVTPSTEYGFTHHIYNLQALNKTNTVLTVKAMFANKSPLKELLLCVMIKSKEKDVLFLTNDLKDRIKTDKWSKQDFIFSLPQIEEKEFELSVFLWNTGKNNVFYDDFEITIY